MAKRTCKARSTRGFLAAMIVALVVVVCCCPLAFAALTSNARASAEAQQPASCTTLGVTSNQSQMTSSEVDGAAKIASASIDTSVFAKATDRTASSEYAQTQSALSDAAVMGSYEVDWDQGKLTGDYSTHSASCTYYETGFTYGLAVDVALQDQYPKGTVIELTNPTTGKTTQATVLDYGVWWSGYGHSSHFFDLMPGTCDDLGWDSATRSVQGVLSVTWRVVSYG